VHDEPAEGDDGPGEAGPPAPRIEDLSPRQRALLRRWQRALDRFAERYASRGPVTVTLLAVFVVLHLATGMVDLVAGRADGWLLVFGARSDVALTLLGGRDKALVAAGDTWRLLSAGFLHGDASHLFFNGLAMAGLGRLSEATFGHVRTLAVFVFAVIGGNLLSQQGDAALSIGASGGVFGVMGALVAFGFRRQQAMPPPLRDLFGKSLLKWIGLNLLIGFLLPFVDNRGHIGGLLTGLCMGWFLHDEVLADPDGRVEQATLGLAAACALLLGWALAGVAGLA
jgi:rhomboid protease GluP